MGYIVTAVFDGTRSTRTRRLYEIDKGILLRFVGLDLPDTYQVHFSNSLTDGEAKAVVATGDNVEIPYEYLRTGEDVYAWVYLTPSDGIGYTAYTVMIPVRARPDVSDEEPTEEQQSALDAAIAALNSAVSRTSADADAAAESATEAAASADSAAASAAAAQTSQENAESAADRAETAQSNADASATVAMREAQTAADYAEQAGQSSSDAADYANSASASARQSLRFAQEAATYLEGSAQNKTAADEYAKSARTAWDGAENAKVAAETAQSQSTESAATSSASAAMAAQSELAANNSATSAAASAEQAAQRAGESLNSALNSEESANKALNSAQSAANSADTAAYARDESVSAKNAAESAVAKVMGMTAQAETLPTGSDATAAYSDGVLTIGVPTGATGAQGEKGDPGVTYTLLPEVSQIKKLEDGTYYPTTLNVNAYKTVGDGLPSEFSDCTLVMTGEAGLNVWRTQTTNRSLISMNVEHDGILTYEIVMKVDNVVAARITVPVVIDGDDYILTETDKAEIVAQIMDVSVDGNTLVFASGQG